MREFLVNRPDISFLIKNGVFTIIRHPCSNDVDLSSIELIDLKDVITSFYNNLLSVKRRNGKSFKRYIYSRYDVKLRKDMDSELLNEFVNRFLMTKELLYDDVFILKSGVDYLLFGAGYKTTQLLYKDTNDNQIKSCVIRDGANIASKESLDILNKYLKGEYLDTISYYNKKHIAFRIIKDEFDDYDKFSYYNIFNLNNQWFINTYDNLTPHDRHYLDKEDIVQKVDQSEIDSLCDKSKLHIYRVDSNKKMAKFIMPTHNADATFVDMNKTVKDKNYSVYAESVTGGDDFHFIMSKSTKLSDDQMEAIINNIINSLTIRSIFQEVSVRLLSHKTSEKPNISSMFEGCKLPDISDMDIVLDTFTLSKNK